MSIVNWIVDKYHVGTDPKVIAADITARSERAGLGPEMTALMVEKALKRHDENVALYRLVTGSITTRGAKR